MKVFVKVVHLVSAFRYLIEAILSRLCQRLPGTKVLSIQPLEWVKSFNNRICFIKLSQSDSDPSLLIEEVVLKLSGRFFGPEKVQNEVACLYLLEKHCPSVPTPRVLAWADHAADDPNIHIIARSESGEPKALKEVMTTRLAPLAEEASTRNLSSHHPMEVSFRLLRRLCAARNTMVQLGISDKKQAGSPCIRMREVWERVLE